MKEHDEIARLEEALRAERITVAIQADTIQQIRESNDALTKLCAEQTEALAKNDRERERLRLVIEQVGNNAQARYWNTETLERKDLECLQDIWNKCRAALAPVNGGKA
jgi:hypothetical protein